MSIELNKIYNADCLELMKEIPDKYFDLCLTDPVYGKKCDKGTNGYGDSKNRRYNSKWDNERTGLEYFEEMKRVSKNQIFFGLQYFIDFLTPTNCLIVWDKTGSYKFENPFSDCEVAWTSFNSVSKKYTLIQQGFVKDSKDIVIHPTQKPSELFETILKDFSQEGQTVLDCFSGSGTTAIACHNLNRNFICIEKDRDYYEKSVKRYEEHIKQMRLAL